MNAMKQCAQLVINQLDYMKQLKAINLIIHEV